MLIGFIGQSKSSYYDKMIVICLACMFMVIFLLNNKSAAGAEGHGICVDLLKYVNQCST